MECSNKTFKKHGRKKVPFRKKSTSKFAKNQLNKKRGCALRHILSFYYHHSSSANTKLSCLRSKLACATLMRMGSPKLYFL